MNKNQNLWLGLLVLGAFLGHAAGADEKINPRTLCPVSGSTGQTILLIDTTDPLTLVAQEKLKQLLKAFRDSHNQHYLQRGHELIVYRLTPRVKNMGKPIRVCNPGNPEDRTWIDNLFGGIYGDLRKWRSFEKHLLRSLPRIDEQVSGDQSPLLESIALIAARHVSSIGVKDNRKPNRLILFSDMLQNSDRLSHYKSLPDKSLPGMTEFEKLTGYSEMHSDLTNVNVWLFYVRRPNLEQKQTSKHYYWWTQVVKNFNGKLIEQTPL